MMRISLKTNIKDIRKKYTNLFSKSNLDELENNIFKDLKQEGLQEIRTSVGSSNYEDTEPLNIIERDNAIGIEGTQAIYDEYGTGTMGEHTPHPEKDSASIPLNDYNSGSTIRENTGINAVGNDVTEATKQGIPLNGLYWTYEHEGKKIYTQGRPAGMHVYKAKTRIKAKLKEVIKKRVGELLSNR